MISKRHWSQYVLIPFLTLLGLVFLIFGLSMINDTKKMPFGVYIMIASFAAVSLSLVIFIIYDLKHIQIVGNEMTIVFPVKRKTFKYELSQIKGYNERFDYDKFGEYKTFNFIVDDGADYQFSSREYGNYNDLAVRISSICLPMEISFYKNLKQLLIYFVSTFLLISLLLYISKSI